MLSVMVRSMLVLIWEQYSIFPINVETDCLVAFSVYDRNCLLVDFELKFNTERELY